MMNRDNSSDRAHVGRDNEEIPAPHPRTIEWLGTTALAMGGSNQSLFLIGGATGLIATQGSAAVPLLVLGLILSWMALPGWTELVLMWPNRVGGIAATCSEAFRPISPVLSNLTGICYWWGWIPTCGLTAWLSAKAIHAFYLPGIPDKPLAVGIILLFTWVNLCGIRWTVRLAIPIATISALLALLSGLIPILTGRVDWNQATSYQLLTPFKGWFGSWTSAMSGLYLIGFAAPAFEQAASHVGETIDPERNVPRAMYASAIMATLYFLVLPIVWLGVLGVGPATGLAGELQDVLGPTFSPVFLHLGAAAGVWFMVFNMFHGTLAPLAGAARTFSQLAEDGLVPRVFSRRNRNDAPWVTTCFTAACAIIFLLFDDPVWLIAAANFCYLIGICMPSVAVWLLRGSAPDMKRPYRAAPWAINMGFAAAIIWGISAVFGFQQYGLPAIIIGVALAYSCSLLYTWRRWEDRRRTGTAGLTRSLHFKLTGAMIAVLTLDAIGYLLAVSQIKHEQLALRTALEDIFVLVALLTIGVGLVLPGIITHAAEDLSYAAKDLAHGTMKDFSRAMQSLAAGDLDSAHARVSASPININSRDEIGAMAASFNVLQQEIERATVGLDGAREGLREARSALTQTNVELEQQVHETGLALQSAQEAQERMQESEQRFRQVTEHVREVFWMTDVEKNSMLYISPAYEAVWGRRCSDLYESPRIWTEAIVPEDRQRVQLAMTSKQTRGEYNEEYRILRPNGEIRWIHDRAFPIQNEAGDIYRVVGIAEDITERHLALEAMQGARAEADRANAAKSEFLSRMSHELRTPLNAILGFGQLLDKEELDPMAKESVGYILHGGRHLLNLINEVLDIARVESGRLEVSLEPIALDEVVSETCVLVRSLATERGIHLEENFSQLENVYILADRQRLKQALINLLSNAIKYNRVGGKVNVSCQHKEDGRMLLSVHDTGPGIAPQDLAKLFTAFERLNAENSAIEGTGLGLVLSQRLVTAMGGILSVTSTLGEGTTFTIDLPHTSAPEMQLTNFAQNFAPAQTADALQQSYRILCIEDNPSNFRLIQTILRSRPEIELLSAIQGSVGLDLARQHEPNLILLDLNLPDMHGQEILARLQQSALTRDIPVIVVSADATSKQIERLLNAGANAYLTKPLDVEQFLETLDELLQPTIVDAEVTA